MALAAALAAPNAASSPVTASPASRDDLILVHEELREAYRAATLLPDGRSRRGRKTKHDTATRRWIDTVGFPGLEMGKLPAASDMAMLRLTPRSSLSGANLKARDAWSQLHGRDPRSKKQTAAEKEGQTTLLAWARTNMVGALAPSVVRRGRISEWKIDFGNTWRDHTPRQLALDAAVGRMPRLPTPRNVPAGAFLAWITGQCQLSRSAPFKWRFPSHFYLYLAMRELEGRAVNGNDGPITLTLPNAAHSAYAAYCNISLAPEDIAATSPGDDDHEEADEQPPPAAAGTPTAGSHVAGALRAPPPPEPIDHVETATLRPQTDFFKGRHTHCRFGPPTCAHQALIGLDRCPVQSCDRWTVIGSRRSMIGTYALHICVDFLLHPFAALHSFC